MRQGGPKGLSQRPSSSREKRWKILDTTRKLVASRTLKTVEWQDSTLIKGDLVEELTRLKQQPGKNIIILGSATLVRSLLRDGLLDELNLWLVPIVLGTGQRLFEDGSDRVPLKLVEARTFGTGVVSVTYGPSPPTRKT